MNIIKNGAFGFEGFDSRISPETLSWSQSVIHQHLLSSTVVEEVRFIHSSVTFSLYLHTDLWMYVES